MGFCDGIVRKCCQTTFHFIWVNLICWFGGSCRASSPIHEDLHDHESKHMGKVPAECSHTSAHAHPRKDKAFASVRSTFLFSSLLLRAENGWRDACGVHVYSQMFPSTGPSKNFGIPVVVMFAALAVILWSLGFWFLVTGQPLGVSLVLWLGGLVSCVGGATCFLLKKLGWNLTFEVFMVSTLIGLSVCTAHSQFFTDHPILRHRL